MNNISAAKELRVGRLFDAYVQEYLTKDVIKHGWRFVNGVYFFVVDFYQPGGYDTKISACVSESEFSQIDSEKDFFNLLQIRFTNELLSRFFDSRHFSLGVWSEEDKK